MRVLRLTIAGALLLVTHAAQGLEVSHALTDHLGIAWERELVRFDLGDAGAGCKPQALRLEGPRGALPAQLTAEGQVAAIVDLEAGATDTYTIRCDGSGPAPPSDLRVIDREGGVEVRTLSFGARWNLGGERFASPRAAADVPAPIPALLFEDGAWVPGGRLFGAARIRAWAGRLVARGPVFATAEWHYEYEDGTDLALRAEIVAGDSMLLVDADCDGERADSGFALRVAGPDTRLSLRILAENRVRPETRSIPSGAWADVPIRLQAPGEITRLTPWHDWWNDHTQVLIRLTQPGATRERRIVRRDPGAWVEPVPPGSPRTGPRLRRKQLPLVRTPDGALELRLDAAPGTRRLAVGHARRFPERDTGTKAADDRVLLRYTVLPLGNVGRHLQEVREMVLEWPEGPKHPHLYMNADELAAVRDRKHDPWEMEAQAQMLGNIPLDRGWYRQTRGLGAWLLTGDSSLARRGRLVERLRFQLGLLGVYYMKNAGAAVCALYDALMGSDLLSAEDRRLFRARFAYMAYRMADPGTWSSERGYASGNLNMTVATVMQLGIAGATIPTHPEAGEWMGTAARMLDRLLDEKVGPDGEWPESPAHYAFVASSPILAFALAAQRNGGRDFVNDPRMKRLMLYLAKQYSPPDPRHTEPGRDGKAGVTPPIGRGAAGENFGLHGAYARALAESDPDLSSQLQWLWNRTGRPTRISGEMLGGWEFVVTDPTLPARKPDWEIDIFPRTGVILRNGIGSDDEWWAYYVNENTVTLDGESGTLALVFARGAPISARFAASYPDREELLLSRVLPARGRGTPAERSARFNHVAKQRERTATTALPRQQYVAGRYTIDQPWKKDMGQPQPNSYSSMRILPEWPPVAREGGPGVRWQRQVLFVRAEAPDGAGYFVLRDHVAGGQPTMWQWWSVSERIGGAAEAADRKRFLRGAPGEKTTPPARLPDGARYTALGPYGVDVEFYVAEPRNTPRHTLRFGVAHAYETLGGFHEYQDLFHLQRPDDGVYFVAVFPRDDDAAAPRFETLGKGRVIRVSGDFGEDLVFLSEAPATAEAGAARFRGTAASVQRRSDGLVLALAAAGKISIGEVSLASEGAAQLRVVPGALVLGFDLAHPGTSAHITAPGDWRLADGATGAQLHDRGAWLEVSAPAGVRSVRLVPR